MTRAQMMSLLQVSHLSRGASHGEVLGHVKGEHGMAAVGVLLLFRWPGRRAPSRWVLLHERPEPGRGWVLHVVSTTRLHPSTDIMAEGPMDRPGVVSRWRKLRACR